MSPIHGRPPSLSSGPAQHRARCPIRRRSRIGEVADGRLIEKSVGAETTEDGDLCLRLPDGERRLSRRAATALRDDLTAALSGRRAFVRTVGEHRPDGSYVVARRNADSAGNEKQFRDFRQLETLYERLPDRFDAAAVGDAAGDDVSVSGTRRHMLVRHLAEHPVFDCDLVSEQPLLAEKVGGDGSVPNRANPTESAVASTE